MQINKLHRTAATLAACCAGLLAGASAASATPAVWSGITTPTTTYSNSLPPSFTVKIGNAPTPQTTFTCLYAGTSWQSGVIFNADTFPTSPLTGYHSGLGFNRSCVDGTGYPRYVDLSPNSSLKTMRAEKNGSTYSLIGMLTQYLSVDYGVYATVFPVQPTVYTAAWNNTAHTMTFTDAVIGKVAPGKPLAGQPVKLTGTFTVSPGTLS